MHKIKNIHLSSSLLMAITASIILVVSILMVHSGTVHSQELKSGLCTGADLSLSSNASCTKGGPESGLNKIITEIVTILSVVVGIIAVIMMIIGGAKFITSGGDAGKITSAKQTIVYAIVGLIIVALSQFIVRFVLSNTPAITSS